MAKYRIAWLPGDGIGNDVLEATRIILDKINLDAEYVSGDIGWRFWCEEGDPFPKRTIEMMKTTDCAISEIRDSSIEVRSSVCGRVLISISAKGRARHIKVILSITKKGLIS